MLLYAQPASRIVRLTSDDILRDGDQVLIRLGTPPSPVPEALAGILLQLVDGQPDPTSAANPGNRWLFPGYRAGQPLHPRTLLLLIHQPGIPAKATRVAALRQLVLQARHQSSPTPSATTTNTSPRSGPKQVAPGRPTSPATTANDHPMGRSCPHIRSCL